MPWQVLATVIATIFQGTNWIQNPTGSFYYAPTLAPGNLVISITPNGGTGPFGETVPAGIVVYNNVSSPTTQAQFNQSELQFSDSGGRSTTYDRLGITSSTAGPGVPLG